MLLFLITILTSYRISGYIQNITSFEAGSSQILLNSGFRLNYLNTSGQLVFSPRMSVYLIPAWDNKITFHASAGWYHQPPFFKEMIDPEGKLHRNIKAQQAIHFLAGTTWEFTMWERPFKFSAEAYYKKLDHLIPYIIDDVDIQYLPQYTAKGYAYRNRIQNQRRICKRCRIVGFLIISEYKGGPVT